MSDLWELPGPQAFLRSMARTLGEGRSGILVLPEHRATDDPGEVLASRQRIDREWTRLDLADGAELAGVAPASELAAALGIPAPTGGARIDVHWLTGQDDWFQRVIWVDVRAADGESLQRWSRFLAEYLAAVKAVPVVERSVIVTRCTAEQVTVLPAPDVLLDHHWWWGRIDRIDTLVHVERRAKSGVDPAHRAAIVEVAAHDLDLADVLLDTWDGEIRGLVDVLNRYAASLGWEQADDIARYRAVQRQGDRVPADLVESWSDGRAEWWSDAVVPHRAAIRADGRVGGIDARRWLGRLCWRAQVGTLLPALEAARLELARYAAERQHRLRAESRFTSVRDVLALEYGPLVNYFEDLIPAAGDRQRKEALQELRSARHLLAHANTLDARRIGRIRKSLARIEGLAAS